MHWLPFVALAHAEWAVSGSFEVAGARVDLHRTSEDEHTPAYLTIFDDRGRRWEVSLDVDPVGDDRYLASVRARGVDPRHPRQVVRSEPTVLAKYGEPATIEVGAGDDHLTLRLLGSRTESAPDRAPRTIGRAFMIRAGTATYKSFLLLPGIEACDAPEGARFDAGPEGATFAFTGRFHAGEVRELTCTVAGPSGEPSPLTVRATFI